MLKFNYDCFIREYIHNVRCPAPLFDIIMCSTPKMDGIMSYIIQIKYTLTFDMHSPPSYFINTATSNIHNCEVINNQVLRIIKIAVKTDVKNGRI